MNLDTAKLQSPHYNHGTLPVAFVYSAPGSREKECGRPVAGVTGCNLQMALEMLQLKHPSLFPSTNRYDYRITNAFMQPLARARGDKRSEASAAEILDPRNLRRVAVEVEGCDVVVLCGNRPHLLAPHLCNRSVRIVEAAHTSNQGLVSKHNTVIAKCGASPGDRRRLRAHAWAATLLSGLRPDEV